MVRNKKMIGMILLGIYTIPLVLLLSMQLTKSINRYIVKESMEQSILQKIVLAEQQIKWVDAGNEFLLNGEMFDVHSVRTLPNGLIEITCLSDKKEDQLNQQLDNLLISTKHTKAMLAKIIKIQSLTAIAGDIQSFLILATHTKQLKRHLFSHITTAYLEVIKPPPQFSFFL